MCDEWLAVKTPQKRRPDNDVSYIRSALRPRFGAFQLRDIGTTEIERFKAAAGARSKSTINHRLTLLVSMLRYAVEIGWLASAPRIKKHRLALFDADFRYLRTPAEVRRFLSAARIEGEDVEALYSTAVYSGLRLGELAALRWDDVDFDRRLIIVQRSFEGADEERRRSLRPDARRAGSDSSGLAAAQPVAARVPERCGEDARSGAHLETTLGLYRAAATLRCR